MSRVVSDLLRIMRLGAGRRNALDPDSTDAVFLQYANDFIQLSMPDELKIFEELSTLQFNIDTTPDDGVYNLSDIAEAVDFVNIGPEAMISLAAPADNSVSWRHLNWHQDPKSFYEYWGVNNKDILISGAPTDVLYHGNELVFRTIPDQEYIVYIYGYKRSSALSSEGDPALPYDHWLRYVAYGGLQQYATDYRMDGETKQNIDRAFAHERKLMAARLHNQIKNQRSIPRF